MSLSSSYMVPELDRLFLNSNRNQMLDAIATQTEFESHISKIWNLILMCDCDCASTLFSRWRKEIDPVSCM